MRYIRTIVAALFIGALALSSFAADKPAGKTLYHVVTVKYKDDATPEQIKAAEDAFEGLKTKVPGITSLHHGNNVSPENKNNGFNHCFVLTFASDKDRDGYLVHPDHKALGKVLRPVLAKDGVMVIDFWANE